LDAQTVVSLLNFYQEQLFEPTIPYSKPQNASQIYNLRPHVHLT